MLTIKLIAENTDAVIRGLERNILRVQKKASIKCWN